MNKVFTVSIIGVGSRGGSVYGRMMNSQTDRFKVVALCDISKERLSQYGEEFSISKENRFTDEKLFFEKKRSDILVIATQDKDHVRMSLAGMKLGYDILLEKPISPSKEELYDLLAAQKKYNRKILVCHVLRYAVAYLKIKETLDSGELGKLIRLESLEQVAYWHQAHSFVRGNWRKESETSPMIMAKCCHDLDLIQYYAGAKCKSVYSVGGLSFFKKDNQPEGAADRCADCKYINDCAYSAERLYIERWKKQGSPANAWPYNVITYEVPNTEENLRKAYKNGPYGRCVFACDNDVVDNQSVSMSFENGVEANLVMTAFTADGGRRMTFHCTEGEIRLTEDKDTLEILPFGKEKIVFSIDELIASKQKDWFGHGGGENGLLNALYNGLCENKTASTTLEASIESHLIALAAEESRKTGKTVYIRK